VTSSDHMESLRHYCNSEWFQLYSLAACYILGTVEKLPL